MSGAARFAVSTAFLPVEHLGPIAEAAEELGYARLAVPDHVVHLEELEVPYPYTADGTRRWDEWAPWPDPWVLIGALSQRTTTLEFFTSIFIAPMRNPYVVAKAVGTAAVLSGNRVALGVGVGWSPGEFALLGQDFRTRGRRLDEELELLRELWSPGWNEFVGELHTTPRLTMEPTPTAAIPILVGGLSDAALRRAVRHDGWVGDLFSTDDAIGWVRRLRDLRAATGADGPFQIVVSLNDAFLPEQFQRAFDEGVTEVLTQPWVYYPDLDSSVDGTLEGMARFAADVVQPLAAGPSQR